MSCSDCPNPIGSRNRTGLCRTCCAKRIGGKNAKHALPKNCSDCGKQLVRSATGYCRQCFNRRTNADPVARAHRKEGTQRWNAQNGAKVVLRARKGAATRAANPEYIAKLRETVRTKVQPHSYTPEAIARRDMVKRGRAISQARLPWCPPEWLDHYRLLRRKSFSAAEAKTMTLQAIKDAAAKLSPFERQMRALERGAKLIEVGEGPSLARPGVYRP